MDDITVKVRFINGDEHAVQTKSKVCSLTPSNQTR